MFEMMLISDDKLIAGPFEDWSQVRSPGRAARRRKKHPQRIRLYFKPDPNVYQLPNGSLVAHPSVVDAVRKRVANNPEFSVGYRP